MIYITGATGFIGSRVARRLLERGERVRCLVRSRARGVPLEKLGAELIEGDVADEAAHARGLQGASGAIHLAAIYDIGIVDAAAMQRANVDGTRAFLSAVKKAGTPRAVYISTTVALGPADGSEPRDAYEGPYHSVYHRTKAEAHRLARAAQRKGLPLVIVCPSFVYGPGDQGPAGRFISDLTGHKVPALLTSPSWFSYVYVDDVVAGMVAALDRGAPSEVYVLSGDPSDMNAFAARVTQIAGVRPPRLRFPVFLAKPTGALLDAISRMTGLRFPITREAVQTTAVDRWLHTHERATRDLDYRPRTLAEGLEYLRN
ncbi:MAG: NAD-dependent epimerase/dehydratase family protein [Gemmatimonadota bacterium]